MKKIIFIILILFLFCGCGEEPVTKEHIINIKNLEVHIVPDHTYMPKGFRRESVKGCASSAGKIWIIGKTIDGKIYIDWEVAGHELQHILSYRSRDVGNPDNLM